MKIIIITGMSGAGRSQAIKALEDAGYYCIDNMPPALMPKFMELVEYNIEKIEKVAFVADIRGRRFFDALEKSVEQLKVSDPNLKILFLEASNASLIKRFKETRRSHPLNPSGSIEEGINKERTRLVKIREKADAIIDTSNLSIANFREEIRKSFDKDEQVASLSLTLMSFGFKKGIPLEADFVFDVRMLPNPFYIEELKHLTGNDEAVREYVMSFEESQKYLEHIETLVEYLIPQCVKEGRSQLVVAIGCTGGQHRSVTFANLLTWYYESKQLRVNAVHRELK